MGEAGVVSQQRHLSRPADQGLARGLELNGGLRNFATLRYIGHRCGSSWLCDMVCLLTNLGYFLSFIAKSFYHSNGSLRQFPDNALHLRERFHLKAVLFVLLLSLLILGQSLLGFLVS